MRRIFILVTLLLLLCGCGTSPEITWEDEPTDYRIIVEVRGAVAYPGFYEFSNEIYLYQLIDIAGGLTTSAAIDNLNMLQIIDKNQSIIIPDKDKEVSTALININFAGKELLMTLPRIGEAKANAIIEYRKKNGNFRSTSDLMKVSGIGEAIYQALKDFITV